MPAALRHLIDEIARQADEFLAGITDRRQGRAGLEVFLTLEHADLSPSARKKVIDGVMAVLESDDFFDTEFVGDAFREEEEKDQ